MQRLTLPINEIKVEDRQRIDLGDIKGLADSILQYGLIQPIVVNQQNQLIAGGRRLAAYLSLGRKEIEVTYKETLSQDELHCLELEENVRRLEMSWQERCLCIAKIHELKQQRAALDATSWGQRETGEMFGLSVSKVSYMVKIATYLKDKEHIFWKPQFNSAYDAWQFVIREEEVRINAELAKRGHTSSAKIVNQEQIQAERLVKEYDKIVAQPDSLHDERERYYSNPHNPPGSFETYWTERIKAVEGLRNTVYLSNWLIKGDCIAFMNEPDNIERFDHLVTDIPYGIDLDYINQQNPHVQLKDLDTVEDEHQVEDNLDLMKQFFPASFACLKPNAYLVTWCDAWHFRYMADLALAAGFKVQRWPLTWDKTHTCLNQSAQYNFTKSTEIALVCRKGNATLVKPAPKCLVSASNTDVRKALSHPFAKPFEIWHFILDHISIEGQLILEPFAGRGSGVLAALQRKRNVVACELNEAHYNALLENVKMYYLKLNPKFQFK